MREITANLLSRRRVLRQILAGSLGLPFAQLLGRQRAEAQVDERAATPEEMPVLSADDDRFLDDLERANFQFFWDQGSPNTGMVKDRCDVRNGRQGIAAGLCGPSARSPAR